MLHLEPHRLRVPDFVARVEYSQSIDSTNDAARRLAVEVPPGAGLLVVAEEQTAGRGRGANKWWTGAGSLAFSLLFDPSRYAIETRFSCMVPLAAAVAIVDVVTRRMGTPAVGIRWPNDVYIGPRKLAGILVEALADGRQILGIGLNANNSLAEAPPEVASLAASLVDELGGLLDKTELLAELLTGLDEVFLKLGNDRQELAAIADELCLQRGQPLTIQAGEERVGGVCAGIADDGAVLLDTPAGRRAIYSGVTVKT